MGRRTGLLAAGAAAGLALMLPPPLVNAQTAAPVSIVNSAGVPPNCPTGDTYCFRPPTVTVAAGGTVTWTNNSSATHTVTSTSAEQFNGDVAPGATFQHTFHSPGTFTYYCTIHTYMTGTVQVTGTASSSSSSSSTTAHSTTTTHTTTTTTSTAAHTATTSTTSAAPPPATSAPVAAAGNSTTSSQDSTTSSDTGTASAGVAPPATGGGGSALGWVIGVVVVALLAVGGGVLSRLRRRPI
jgi:plastocyanin